jgi:hypothetical protein
MSDRSVVAPVYFCSVGQGDATPIALVGRIGADGVDAKVPPRTRSLSATSTGRPIIQVFGAICVNCGAHQVWVIFVPSTVKHSRMKAASPVQPFAETIVPST